MLDTETWSALARSGVLTPVILLAGGALGIASWLLTGAYLKRRPGQALPLTYFFGGLFVGMMLRDAVRWLADLL